VKLLLVHGRAQEGKSAEGLLEEWMRALRIGLGKVYLNLPTEVEIDVPFYGDALKSLVERRDLPPAGRVASRGDIDDTYAEFLQEVAIEAREKNIVSSADLERELTNDPETRGLRIGNGFRQCFVRLIVKFLMCQALV
jgi:hypothetical protein